MALSITYDVNIGGITGSLNTDGENYTMVHLIQGVTGNPGGLPSGAVSGSAQSRIWECMDYLQNLGFVIGVNIDTYNGSWLRAIDIAPLNNTEADKFLATLTYKSNPYQNIKISSSVTLSQISTNLTKSGGPIEVTYTYPSEWVPDSDLAGKTIIQGGVVDKLVPEETLTFRLRETIDPTTIAKTYVGKVNSATWWGDYAAGFWLCTGVVGENDFSTYPWEYYNNVYTFQRREGVYLDGDYTAWEAYVAFIDKSTGKPPPDILGSAQPTAALSFIIYDEVDFNNLFLWDS